MPASISSESVARSVPALELAGSVPVVSSSLCIPSGIGESRSPNHPKNSSIRRFRFGGR
jgi:hypothetical protein